MPTSASTKKTATPKLALAVQYAAGTLEGLPTRPQVRRWVRAALPRQSETDAEITVRFVAAEEGQALNRDYRGKDYATNVLSFVYASEPVNGDLVICVPVVAREAREQNKTLEAHYAHLLVHGVLHLQGFDHETEKEARSMEAREREIVTQLGYTDPYGDA